MFFRRAHHHQNTKKNRNIGKLSVFQIRNQNPVSEPFCGSLCHQSLLRWSRSKIHFGIWWFSNMIDLICSTDVVGEKFLVIFSTLYSSFLVNFFFLSFFDMVADSELRNLPLHRRSCLVKLCQRGILKNRAPQLWWVCPAPSRTCRSAVLPAFEFSSWACSLLLLYPLRRLLLLVIYGRIGSAWHIMGTICYTLHMSTQAVTQLHKSHAQCLTVCFITPRIFQVQEKVGKLEEPGQPRVCSTIWLLNAVHCIIRWPLGLLLVSLKSH